MFSILNIDDGFAERIIIRIFCFVIDEYDDYVQSLKKLLLSFSNKHFEEAKDLNFFIIIIHVPCKLSQITTNTC